MDNQDRKILRDFLEGEVERAINRGELSQQPAFRLDEENEGAGLSWGDFVKWASVDLPPYRADSRKRDKALIEFARNEPHLEAIIHQVRSLVKNRGWSLIGGRNQVLRGAEILHDADRPEGARFGKGWRHYISRLAGGYFNTDMGSISELGRDFMEGARVAGIVPPLRSLWSADSTRFKLTGNNESPLMYFPRNAKSQPWTYDDYMRITSNPAIEDKYKDLGYCAVSVCAEVAKLLMAVYEYDREQLGAKAPKGLLILNNISQAQWKKAMQSRAEELTGARRDFYGGVAVLASIGAGIADAKLIALSNLPAEFKRQEVITMAIYLYSMAFGFPADEFWPVQFGNALGRSNEAQIGFERAVRKGDADFFMDFEDSLQRELPGSLSFQFDERGDKGLELEAEIFGVYSRASRNFYEPGLLQGAPLLTREEIMRILVDKGQIPAEFTAQTEEDQTTDEDPVALRKRRAKVRTMPRAWRAAEIFPDEPIVEYCWPKHRMNVIYESGTELLRPHVFRGVDMTGSDEMAPPEIFVHTNGNGYRDKVH